MSPKVPEFCRQFELGFVKFAMAFPWESVSEAAMQDGRLEKEHVHQIYDLIAPHFSSTRYKVSPIGLFFASSLATLFLQPWPMVDDFLKSQSPFSVIADVGCGNGKYMTSNPLCLFQGSDRCIFQNSFYEFIDAHIHRSIELAKICVERGLNAIVCDNRHLPYSTALFVSVFCHFFVK